MAWPRALCAETSSSPSTTNSTRLGGIQSPEVLEHEAPLLGGETRQLFPRRIAQPRTRSRSAGLEQRGKVHTVAGRGAAGALRFLVGLATGQRAAGIEQAAVETLLALDRLLVQPPRLQLVRQLARLLRERAGGGAPGFRLQPLELLGERALTRGQGAQLLQHRPAAQTHHREEPTRLPVQPLLVARHPGEQLYRFGKPASRLRARYLAAAAGEGERCGVERVHRLLRQRRGLAGVRLSLLELLARRRHLALREAERPLELRRHERVLPGRFAELALDRCCPLLDRGLSRPSRGTAVAAAHCFGPLLLALRPRRPLRERPIEGVQRFLTPRPCERVASGPQRAGQLRELLLRLLSGLLRPCRVAPSGGLGGALHRSLCPVRGLLRRRERLAPQLRSEVLPHLFDAVRQRIGALCERALARGGRAVRAARVRPVPLGLAPFQILRIGGERGKRPFGRRPAEQLPAPLELRLELLLRFGEPL